MKSPIPIDIQAFAAECSATNQRSAAERHREMAQRKKWPADSIPGDLRYAEELEAVALTMRKIHKSDRAKAALIKAWAEDAAELKNGGM